MRKKIVSVGMEVPSNDVEYIEFDSDQSLLDADIVLYEPTLGDYPYTESKFQGKPSLSEPSSFQVRKHVDHWKSELFAAFNAGKFIVIFLATPTEVFVRTGEKQCSGTGRSRQVTNIVAPLSSYDAIPLNLDVTARRGSRIAPAKDLRHLVSYWSAFASMSAYEVTIEGKFSETLLVTKSGHHIVGAAVRKAGSGHILLLPPIRYDEDKFLRSNEDESEYPWTDKAMQHGHSFVSAFINMAAALQADTQLTPPPEWVRGNEYRLAAEAELEKKLQSTRERIDKLNTTKSNLENKLQRAGQLRYLLYERGKPLEAAIIEALSLFGFRAKPFEDAESEFDAVFESPEGRCLGEVEGKDNYSINIDKIRQLESNIQEDFAKDNVNAYAKGVLFGNAFRLMPVARRKPAFTDKCMAAALRSKVALVHTPDMFEPARFLKASRNAAYARLCRKAIFETEGQVVEFPEVPNPPQGHRESQK